VGDCCDAPACRIPHESQSGHLAKSAGDR
jgi:hypothetical protein